MSEVNLSEVHDFAVDLAKKAARMILEASNKRLSSTATTTSEKKNCQLPLCARDWFLAVDLVTEADQAVEEMVKMTIRETYPNHK